MPIGMVLDAPDNKRLDTLENIIATGRIELFRASVNEAVDKSMNILAQPCPAWLGAHCLFKRQLDRLIFSAPDWPTASWPDRRA